MPRSRHDIGSQVAVGNRVFTVVRRVESAGAPVTPPSKGLVIVYPAADGDRWQLMANGNVLADSGQSYDRPSKAERAAKRVFGGLYPVVTVEAL